MSTSDHKSSIINYQLSIARLVLIAFLVVAVFAVGHYGFRFLREPGAAASGGGQMQFGAAAGRDAADVPPPPESERAFAQTAQRGPERVIAAYTSREAPAAVIAFYRTTMPSRGWTERAVAPGTGDEPPGSMLRYSNTTKDLCMITVSEAPSGGSYVTIFRWPAPVVSGGRR